MITWSVSRRRADRPTQQRPGRFSSGARQFAEQVAMRLVLIDGTELTRLMVRYNVGVAVRETYELKAVDDDFFEDNE